MRRAAATAFETLLCSSVRPADDERHAVSRAGRVCTVDAATGIATLKSTFAADPADTPDRCAGLAAGDTAALDVPPAVDRLDSNGPHPIDRRNPPNDGTSSAPVALGAAFTGTAGYGIDPATIRGHAALTVGGASKLDSIDRGATTTAATRVNPIAGNEAVLGPALAIRS